MKKEQRKNSHMSEKGKNEIPVRPEGAGLLRAVIVTLILSAACIVFEILCLRYFTEGWIFENANWLTAVAWGLTVAYALFAIWAVVRKKETLSRLLLSGYILLIFSFVLLFILLKTGFLEILRSEELLKEYLENAGGWMPVLFIVLQYLQVVVLPIPAVVSTAAGVGLFGATKAFLYSLAGVLLGSFTAFIIGRKLGAKAVSWIVGKDDLEKWQKKLKGKDNFILTAMFILPLFPDDLLCFVAGLSSMTWQYFSVMICVARTIGISLTCYSIDFIPFNTWWGLLIWAALIVIVIVLFVLLYKYMDAINVWAQKHFLFFRSKKDRKGKKGDSAQSDKKK